MAFRLPVVSEPEIPDGTALSGSGRLPKWLKRPIPKSNANHMTAELLDELRLETVCDNAKCPQPNGVLQPANGDLHDPRQCLHPALRFLRGKPAVDRQ